jgi:SPP1 family predicted phage head-tail adaptor
MARPDPGRLNKTVTIEEATVTRGASYGEPSSAWSTFLTADAAIEPLQGREFFENLEQQGELIIRIWIRQRPGVTEKMRVVYGERTFEIQNVIDPFEEGAFMQLMCVETREGNP